MYWLQPFFPLNCMLHVIFCSSVCLCVHVLHLFKNNKHFICACWVCFCIGLLCVFFKGGEGWDDTRTSLFRHIHTSCHPLLQYCFCLQLLIRVCSALFDRCAWPYSDFRLSGDYRSGWVLLWLLKHLCDWSDTVCYLFLVFLFFSFYKTHVCNQTK